MEGRVVGYIVVKLRSARLGRLLLVDHRREDIVIDFDGIQRVLRDIAVYGDHGGHAISDEPDGIDGQRPVFGHLEIAVGNQPCGGDRRQPVEHVLAGIDGDDTWHRPRFGGVDMGDPGMRVGAAENRQGEHPWEPDIVGEAALPADKAGILTALHGSSEESRDCHVILLRYVRLDQSEPGTLPGGRVASRPRTQPPEPASSRLRTGSP